MKDTKEVIHEFNDVVNMTASELEEWLQSQDSGEAGWPKDGDNSETVGHDSGRKITQILKSNPSKDPKKYTEDQTQHMRKVVAYCKRHLAQEKPALENKSSDEIKKMKSYISLKNWGHDYLKKNNKGGGRQKENTGNGQEQRSEAGDKRKRDDKKAAPEPKKHRTRQTSKHEAQDTSSNAADAGEKSSKFDENNSKGKNINPGDTVSWNWGNGQPEGKVLDVKEKKTTVTTKRGSKVSRDGNRNDPAVVLDTGKSKAIKSAHELNNSRN